MTSSSFVLLAHVSASVQVLIPRGGGEEGEKRERGEGEGRGERGEGEGRGRGERERGEGEEGGERERGEEIRIKVRTRAVEGRR